ncbi:hypothetical protein R3P38DRAFT_2770820 [Favolaschia claudopus]|uniref:Uncharacterized protein n=1 Tax=Favolaschia claudopus TaxID=2862362 RepID=A0AAW0CGK5_9AGAR
MSVLPSPLSLERTAAATSAPSKFARRPRSEAGFLSSRPFVFVPTDPATVLSRRTAGALMRLRSTDLETLPLRTCDDPRPLVYHSQRVVHAVALLPASACKTIRVPQQDSRHWLRRSGKMLRGVGLRHCGVEGCGRAQYV